MEDIQDFLFFLVRFLSHKVDRLRLTNSTNREEGGGLIVAGK